MSALSQLYLCFITWTGIIKRYDAGRLDCVKLSECDGSHAALRSLGERVLQLWKYFFSLQLNYL